MLFRSPDQRPHFITLYYSNVDHAGHQFGPDSPQVAAAVRHVDALVGSLQTDLDGLHLPIDLVVVSDNGMVRQQGGWVDLDSYTPLTNFTTVGALLYANSDADAQIAYDRLKSADGKFQVYRRAQVPAELHYNSNPREGDPVIVPSGPYPIRAQAPPPGREDRAPNTGAHGFDPYSMPEMKAIFYADGPDIKPGFALKPFDNVNVYPFLVHILGLESGPVDGSFNVLSGALVRP